jgi:hypothetical protein
MPSAWRHVVVGQSFLIGSGTFAEPILVKDGVDFLAVEGRSIVGMRFELSSRRTTRRSTFPCCRIGPSVTRTMRSSWRR